MSREDPYDRRVRSLARWLTIAIDLAIGVASVTAAVVAIAFVVFLVTRHVWRSEPPPRGAILGVRCHWNGPWLIARGTVVNLSDHDASFEVLPNVAVAGRGGFPREEDDVSVRRRATRGWRWTSDRKSEASGTPVSRCSARVSGLGGGRGDD